MKKKERFVSREVLGVCKSSDSFQEKSVPAIEIFKRIMISQLETGTPYMFYRDTVNRINANPS